MSASAVVEVQGDVEDLARELVRSAVTLLDREHGSEGEAIEAVRRILDAIESESYGP